MVTSRKPQPLQLVSPIHKAGRQIGEFLGAPSRRYGIESREGHILSYVTLYGPCPASELTRVFGHAPSTLTGILDRLESKGLLERLANPEDRRSFLLRATRQGRAVATKLRGLLETLESEVLARVTARDAAGFAAVMAAIGEVTGVELRKESER